MVRPSCRWGRRVLGEVPRIQKMKRCWPGWLVWTCLRRPRRLTRLPRSRRPLASSSSWRTSSAERSRESVWTGRLQPWSSTCWSFPMATYSSPKRTSKTSQRQSKTGVDRRPLGNMDRELKGEFAFLGRPRIIKERGGLSPWSRSRA